MAFNIIIVDEEVENILDFYEVITHNGSRDKLKNSIIDIVKKWGTQ